MIKFFYETFIFPRNPEETGWFVWVGFSTILLWFFFWWSIGMVPALGAGFARAETQVQIRVYLIENDILDRRIRYCSAQDDTSVKQFFYHSLQEKLHEYRDLTTSDYTLPACSDLVPDH